MELELGSFLVLELGLGPELELGTELELGSRLGLGTQLGLGTLMGLESRSRLGLESRSYTASRPRSRLGKQRRFFASPCAGRKRWLIYSRPSSRSYQRRSQQRIHSSRQHGTGQHKRSDLSRRASRFERLCTSIHNRYPYRYVNGQ